MSRRPLGAGWSLPEAPVVAALAGYRSLRGLAAVLGYNLDLLDCYKDFSWAFFYA